MTRYSLSISGLELCSEEALDDALDTLRTLISEGQGPITIWVRGN